ncbi:MAG: hypothetical protein NDJ65_07570 [Paludibacteraceae bacterium]|nr:hypothetical protein [Paludibacteraceae bacterium]
MEYYNNILCVEAKWLMDSGVMSKANYLKLSDRADINVVRRGCRGTSALVAYESMPERFKSKVREMVGDVYKAAGRNDVEPLIEHSTEAADYFEHYRTADGKFLPEERRREYYANAVVMDAMGRYIKQRQAKRRALGGKAKRLWDEMALTVQELDRQKWPHSLPSNARSLERKFKLYLSEGLESLVHNAYKAESKNARKVDSEQQRSMMGMLVSDPRNLDNEQVAQLYNTMAKAMQWPTICASTVGVWREKLDNVVYARRRGGSAYRNNKAMQVKRSAPETALTYWTMDGWDAELMYQSKDKNGTTTYHHRLTVVVVLDTCCKYPVGYAIGDHETPQLIKAALRDAARHTEQLFGQMYRTMQLQSDNYAISKMTPLYAQVAQHVTPAEHGNAKAKVIEPWFRYFNKKYCQTQKNWSGFGITSRKELQPNGSFLNKHRHEFPTEEEAYEQLAAMMEAERAEKRAQYMEMYDHTPDDRKMVMSAQDYLRAFGERTGQKNLMQGSGLKVTIEGRKMTYDCFDPEFRKWASTRWTVLYDPADRSKALAVNDDESLQFMLEEKYVQPMALADRTDGDYEQLQRVRDFNAREDERIKREIGAMQETAEALLADGRKELETLHKLMICDSRGQHKDRRETARLATESGRKADIEDAEIETEDTFYDIL